MVGWFLITNREASDDKATKRRMTIFLTARSTPFSTKGSSKKKCNRDKTNMGYNHSLAIHRAIGVVACWWPHRTVNVHAFSSTLAIVLCCVFIWTGIVRAFGPTPTARNGLCVFDALCVSGVRGGVGREWVMLESCAREKLLEIIPLKVRCHASSLKWDAATCWVSWAQRNLMSLQFSKPGCWKNQATQSWKRFV